MVYDLAFINPFEIVYKEEIITSEIKPVFHYHNAYEISFYLESENEMFVHDSKYHLLPNHIVFIPPYTNQCVFYKTGTKYSRYILSFEYDYIAGLLYAAEGYYLLDILNHCKPSIISLNIVEKSKMEVIFAKLLTTYQAQKKNKSEANKLRTKLLIATSLIEIMHLFTINNNDEKNALSDDYVISIITYINQNYMNPVTLDLLAAELFISSSSACHKFKETTGITIIEYLNNTRIKQAINMLRKKECSITEVCFSCGFNNLQHFYRVFRKQTNTTPGFFKGEMK